jgi:hypothetical protein
MDGKTIVGIFERDDFGKYTWGSHKIQDGLTEAIGRSADKLTSMGIVFKEKLEEAHQASMIVTFPASQEQSEELTRLVAVFLELASPEKPNKEAWLIEYLAKIKPTAKNKTPKIRVFWDKLEVKMQHLGNMGGVLITLNEEAS